MKRIFTILFLLIWVDILIAQDLDTLLVEYNSSFGGYGSYELSLKTRKISYYTSAILLDSNGKPISKSHILSPKRLDMIKHMVNQIKFETLDSVKSGFDGAWIIIDLKYSNNTKYKYKVWEGGSSTPAALIDLIALLRNNYK